MTRNLLIVFILLTVLSSASYVYLQFQGKSKVASTSTPTSVTLPEQKVVEAKEEVVKATSLDGSKILTMKMNTNGDSVTYTFLTDQSNPLFTQTIIGPGTTMELPANAWSPGEKYVFLQQTNNGVKNDFVLNASGEAFANGEQFLDVGAMFKAKEIPYTFQEATGWADSSLLIVTTTKEDGTRGPNFWFELPSGGFIQLAR